MYTWICIHVGCQNNVSRSNGLPNNHVYTYKQCISPRTKTKQTQWVPKNAFGINHSSSPQTDSFPPSLKKLGEFSSSVSINTMKTVMSSSLMICLCQIEERGLWVWWWKMGDCIRPVVEFCTTRDVMLFTEVAKFLGINALPDSALCWGLASIRCS